MSRPVHDILCAAQVHILWHKLQTFCINQHGSVSINVVFSDNNQWAILRDLVNQSKIMCEPYKLIFFVYNFEMQIYCLLQNIQYTMKILSCVCQ